MPTRSHRTRTSARNAPAQPCSDPCPRLQQVRKLRGAAERESGKRCASVLHEVAAQSMQAVQLGLKRLRAEQVEGYCGHALIDGLLDEVTCAIGALRDVSNDLRPLFLERLSIVDAIRMHCGQIASAGKVHLRVAAKEAPIRLTEDVKFHCFLGFRLALDNAVRHARATRIHVVVETLMPDRLSLRVIDNGIGFDTEHRPHRLQDLGLRMIKEHAETVLGQACIQSQRGLGTMVEMVVPLSAPLTPAKLPVCDRKMPRCRPEARKS